MPIPNNTDITVGILAANRNPEIWGRDSYEWKPERWLTALPDSVSAAHVPGVYSNLWVQLILKHVSSVTYKASSSQDDFQWWR